MKIRISTDSAADLSKELIEKYDIAVMPFSVTLGDETRYDGVDLTGAELLEFVDRTDELPKTAAPSDNAYQEHFAKILETCDKVIHFSISNELSMSCSNAIKASKAFDGNVAVIDTKSLSSGIALPALYACDLIKEEKPFEEIVTKCTEVVPHVQASFTLDSLKLLHKGGRCSGTTKLLAMALSIKPSMQMKDGKLGAYRKYMMKKFEVVVKKYVLDTLAEFSDYDTTRVFITHTPTNSEVVNMVKEMVKDKFDEVIECEAGATISSHCGKNTIGILYINKKRD